MRVHWPMGTQSVKNLLDIIMADIVEIIFLATECLALAGVIPWESILS